MIHDDASSGLMDRVMESSIPNLLNQFTPEDRARLTSVALWEFSANWEYVSRREGPRPRLRDDLVGLSAALGPRGGILITIDEVAAGRTRLRELGRFALEVQHALTAGAQIMVVFAGVRIDLDELLKQPHLTFLRRSKDMDFRRLSPHETSKVLQQTAELGNRSIDDDALMQLVAVSQGYPYLVQLAGDYAWRHSPNSPAISLEDAQHSVEKSVSAIQTRVLSRVYDDLSDIDKQFLQAMSMDEGRSKMADIVHRMGQSDQYVQVYKKRLIDSGYVQRSGHGYVEFSLPYLDQYIRSLGVVDDDGPEHAENPWDDFPPPKL